MIFATTYPRSDLKPPYKSVRHIFLFDEKADAERLCRILNTSVYKPVGLTSEEVDVLYREGRVKYYIEKTDGKYEVLERICYAYEGK